MQVQDLIFASKFESLNLLFAMNRARDSPRCSIVGQAARVSRLTTKGDGYVLLYHSNLLQYFLYNISFSHFNFKVKIAYHFLKIGNRDGGISALSIRVDA